MKKILKGLAAHTSALSPVYQPDAIRRLLTYRLKLLPFLNISGIAYIVYLIITRSARVCQRFARTHIFAAKPKMPFYTRFFRFLRKTGLIRCAAPPRHPYLRL